MIPARARQASPISWIKSLPSMMDLWNTPTFIHRMHKTYEGDQPPDQKTDELGEIVWVKKSEIERYGYQSILKPVDRYRAGLKSVDDYSTATFGKKFVDLSEDEQDQVLGAMKEGNASDFFKDPTDKQFFDMFQDDTIRRHVLRPSLWRQQGHDRLEADRLSRCTESVHSHRYGYGRSRSPAAKPCHAASFSFGHECESKCDRSA